MSHEPPVPQGNQSPFPLREAPHAKPAEPAADRREKPGAASKADHHAVGVVLGVAAVVAAGAGVAAYLTSRRRQDEVEAKPAKAKRAAKDRQDEAPAKRKPRKTAAQSNATPRRKSARASAAAGNATDNPVIRGARDAAHIALSEAHEVAYWTKKFGVDRAQLQAAVDQVGHGAKAVGAFFAGQKADDQA